MTGIVTEWLILMVNQGFHYTTPTQTSCTIGREIPQNDSPENRLISNDTCRLGEIYTNPIDPPWIHDDSPFLYWCLTIPLKSRVFFSDGLLIPSLASLKWHSWGKSRPVRVTSGPTTPQMIKSYSSDS